jgi:hypothetical protein
MNQIDIRTHDDIQRLTGAIQELKGILLLIYSDQCGHCHTYRPFWKKLHNIKNRKMGLVSVERNMLPHTPWANVEHRGYPSVIQIDEEGKAHPVENIRDEKNMNAVVNGNTELNEPELEESSSDEEYPNNPPIINETSRPLSKENYEEITPDTNAKINTRTNANLNNLNSQKQNSKYRGGRNNNYDPSSSESEGEENSPQEGGRRRPKKRISKKKTIRKRGGRKYTRRQKQKNLKRR